MNKDITLEDIKSFEKKYNNKQNKNVEDKIKKYGLKYACLNNKDYKFEFNLELPDVKIYNQFDSHECNIYAFLRVVKDILRKNTNLDVDNLDISANYISFYDKLEKINTLYNEIIDNNITNLNTIVEKTNSYIGSYGTFNSCREIVNKYGLALSKDMPELKEKYNDKLTIELLRNKVKIDIKYLINLDKKEEKLKYKKKMLYEAYEFLAKVYGTPPNSFIFNNETLTPIEFKNKYLKDILENYVTITSIAKEDLYHSNQYIPNIYLNDKEKIITLKENEIEKSIINQLKSGISIWFSSEESTTSDYEIGILDDEVYNFENILNIKKTNKREKILLDIINYDHAMCITGANIKNNKIETLKVDNSFGQVGKHNGHFMMTSSFLKNSVITLIIDKKNIAKENIELL